MKDVFDSGRRDYFQAEVVLKAVEGSTDEDSSCSNKEEEEENVQDKDVEPGSKRDQRTRSLEEAVDVPMAKRLSRDQCLVEISVVAQERHGFEVAYVMDLVG
uniref:Uncharacterized protein n=1 Tax=Peronospora matthiolae TaxID=2874970 RepID=A0AAV1TU43_9STRA